MSDLISRSALIKALEEDKRSINSHVYGCINPCDADDLEFELEWVIYNQPTAYNVDKVVAELESEARFYNSASNSDQCVRYGIKKAIEIVRKDGVDGNKI